eukprot:1521710-Rhodomonas_salina.2
MARYQVHSVEDRADGARAAGLVHERGIVLRARSAVSGTHLGGSVVRRRSTAGTDVGYAPTRWCMGGAGQQPERRETANGYPNPIVLRARYAMSGLCAFARYWGRCSLGEVRLQEEFEVDYSDPGTCLRACYAMPGTMVLTERTVLQDAWARLCLMQRLVASPLSSNALAMRCPVLT